MQNPMQPLITTRQRQAHDASTMRSAEVLTSLRLLGANEYDLLLPETHYLPSLLHQGEVILGAVYGRYRKENEAGAGRGLLVVTNDRILFIDKKPLLVRHEDISFDVVSGIMFGSTVFSKTIKLETRLGTIKIRTFNGKCARQFVETVEDMLFARQKGYINDYTR